MSPNPPCYRTLLASCLLAASLGLVVPLVVRGEEVPATVLWEGDHLARIRAGELKDNEQIAAALTALRERADAALERGPYSVVTHGELAASGDPHDYACFATYWWPNPDTKDGLPYVRRDGITNTQLLAQGDSHILSQMSRDVSQLALAGYLLREPRYSQHAARLLRTWFLEKETRMNPNLRHAQLIRGRNTGRYIGLINSKDFVPCLEAAELLQIDTDWSNDDHQGLQQWFRAYLTWFQEDEFGIQEHSTRNNHATFYDVQAARFALFVGDRATARRVIEEAKSLRIDSQIEPDGSQPLEIDRTRSLNYSKMNLRGFCLLARMGEHVGVDLWNYRSEDGRSIRAAADFLLPYLHAPSTWPHKQIVPPSNSNTVELLLLLATRYDAPKYLEPVLQSSRSGGDLAWLTVSPRGLLPRLVPR